MNSSRRRALLPNKSKHLIFHNVDAHAFSSDAIVSAGDYRPSHTAADKTLYYKERDQNEDKACGERGDFICARRALRSLYYRLSALGEIEVGGAFVTFEIKYNMQTVFINADNKAVDKILDNLSESESNYGEIVAAQTQIRKPTIAAKKAPTSRATARRITLLSMTSPSNMDAITPEKAPTLINPA